MPTVSPLPPPLGFLAKAEEFGIAFDEGDLGRLGMYLALLLETNKSFNLTAITDPAEAWERHVLDSLTLVPTLGELAAGAEIVDVGSGGGAPGLVLGSVCPGNRFTLVEATGKKARFLEETARAMGLANVRVIADRAENLGRDHREHREKYDAALARAVGRIAVVAELVIPLLKVGGLALLTKGRQAEEEIAEAKEALFLLHAAVAGVVETPTGRVVAIEKRRQTPRIYPRRPGEPARSPLGVGPRVAPRVPPGDDGDPPETGATPT